MSSRLRPLCFVALPYGKRARAAGEPVIDFDAVYELLRATVEATGFECVRADFELGGGFVQRSLFERLIVAEYVLADLTVENAHVGCVLGLRQGATVGATLLVAETASARPKTLPFDLAPLRLLTYALGPDGKPEPASAEKFGHELSEQLGRARRGELQTDNPVLQITQPRPVTTEHEKTELFLARMQYAGDIARRAAAAIAGADTARAVRELDALEQEILADGADLRDLHASLLSVYLGYRAKSAFERMVELFERMPRELRETPVAREQLALAQNRLAERAAQQDHSEESGEWRSRALASLDGIAPERWTSETFAILGRIHKGAADADWAAKRAAQARGETERAAKLGLDADARLTQAIDAYERGFRADPRDYYPGVNAVTLRVVRDAPEDAPALDALLPVVRFAAARAPEPKTNDERYWLAATKLELATTARDFSGAERALREVLAAPGTQRFMRETTCKNLTLQLNARRGEAKTTTELERIIAALKPKE
jgi:hypothetical protein